MKCFNCNNDIPDASVTCPFCNSKVEPVASPTPIFNLDATSSLPVTPASPVLPQDQTQPMNANIPNSISGNMASMNENIQMPNQDGMSSTNVGNNQMASSMQTSVPVQEVSSNVQSIEQGENVNSMVLNEKDVNVEQTPPAPPIVENAINPAFIDPQGELIDGGKIGSTIAPVVKNKNKKKMLIILIVVAVVLIIGGLGFAYYYSQYKTANKRVSKVFSGITSMTSTLKNETIDKTSGSYVMDLNIDYNDEAIKTKMSGTYARDLSSGILDLTLNLENFTKGEELLNNPINVEFYYNDSKIYVLLENFFDMYIYDEYSELKTYFEAIEQNSINYVTLINTLKRAVNSGLTSMNSTQTVKSVNVHGVSSKANVVSIRFNSRNKSLFYNNFIRVLVNDKTFISEVAKLTGKDEDTIKDKMSDDAQNKEYSDTDLTMEIITEKFGNKFLGIKVMMKENFINDFLKQEESDEIKVLELYPITNGYGLTYKDGSQNVFEGTIEKTMKRTSTTNESNHKVYFTYYQGAVAYKIDASLDLVEDVNPKDAKVNVKNSINKVYLTEENKNTILEKYNQSGSISLYYPDILKNYLGVTEDNTSLTPDNAKVESCVAVANCVVSDYEGYSICKTSENTDVICQNDWLQ